MVVARRVFGFADTRRDSRRYLKLVDRFYKENAEMIAPRQYEAAMRDVEYFLRLVYLALEYYGKAGCTGGSGHTIK